MKGECPLVGVMFLWEIQGAQVLVDLVEIETGDPWFTWRFNQPGPFCFPQERTPMYGTLFWSSETSKRRNGTFCRLTCLGCSQRRATKLRRSFKIWRWDRWPFPGKCPQHWRLPQFAFAWSSSRRELNCSLFSLRQRGQKLQRILRPREATCQVGDKNTHTHTHRASLHCHLAQAKLRAELRA